jgi:transient receptor potential cation channel subfamily M protein 3
VILGLLCPFYIAKLEFKSKEELQLMPQTEEEHLIGLEEENESTEGQPADPHHNTDPDAEVSLWLGCGKNKTCSQQLHCHGIVKLIVSVCHHNKPLFCF